MQKEAARKLIRDTFEGAFNKDKFKKFIKELLNHIEDAPFTYRGEYIYKDYRDSIKTLERIGKYEDSDGKKIDVLIVNLLKTTSLERARSKQRNFIAKYLNGSRGNELKDAALVAFVSPDEQDWRFSFVKMEYKFDTTKKGQPRVKEEFTPAKRYSFLVGENENTHTAQSRLLPILENTDNDPALSDIEEAFSIETVTKEFFEKYRGLFLEINEALDKFVKKDKATKADFQEKGVDTVDFTKKLLGQIVFLYFLQKKGWFGVGKRSAWGTGPKRFLRELFDKKHGSYKNFFNDILEPLFYNTLAVERPGDYSDKFDCRIPFLNGGLFDSLNDYDWQRTDILLSDKLFSNDEKTKQGDVGTGILDVFDRYNFTVKEDEPLEKEVAIDPEMLGKVFENLLEVKDRKSKGTYYTPREIVHYMCQESLINYLATELKEQVKKEDIETLIKHGETALENDTLVSGQGEEKGRYKYKLPQSVREHNELIDRKLAEIKVCDPAVGSGAFLVGMMSEIVKTRSVLARLKNPDKEPSIYDFKRDAIQDSLHGVDIDLGAVEIAKLRLWLSLIVDEDDYKHIKPLPNLDYKIMQGNSLLEEYEGIKLIDERFFEKHEEKEQVQKRLKEQQNKLSQEYIGLHKNDNLTSAKKAELNKHFKEIDKQLKALEQPTTNGQDPFDIFGQTEAQSKADKLLELHERFFNAYHKSDKDRIHKQINDLTWNLVETTLKQKGKEDKLKDVRRFQQTNTNPFFLWRLNFAEVFRKNNGFDVMIANPPYIFARDSKKKGLSSKDKEYYYRKYSLAKYQLNTYPLFIECAHRYLKTDAVLSFIVPNNWLTINTNKDLRCFILSQHDITIINFYTRVFVSANVDSSIIIYKRGQTENATIQLFEYHDTLNKVYECPSDYFLRQKDHIINVESFKNPENADLIMKIESQSHGLDDVADVKVGLKAYQVGKGRPKQTKKMKVNRVFHSTSQKTSKYYKYLQGRDVCRYHIRWSGEYLHYGEHLAEPRTNFHLFDSKRILVRQIPSKPPYCINSVLTKELYLNDLNSINVINIKDMPEYIVAVLNSRVTSFWFVHKFGKMQRGIFPQFKVNELKQFPIPDADASNIKTIAGLSGKISESIKKGSKSDTTRFDKLIDQEIYKLYKLTDKEIAIVEGANGKK